MPSVRLLSLLISLSMIAACQPPIPVPSFEAEVLDENVAIGYGLDIGDVDGDGKDDILLADKKQFVWYRNGDWKRFVMVDSLTERDNVCIAARDIDGDGRVEVAVGAQWNPGETSNDTLSGSVHYLLRPEDPTQGWERVQLYHEPTVHRMKWIQSPDGQAFLTMLPLHGVGNKGGEGAPVNLIMYPFPGDPSGDWKYEKINTGMHMTHNYEGVENAGESYLLIGGKEGIRKLVFDQGVWTFEDQIFMSGTGFGEVRMGKKQGGIAGISPMHGNSLIVGGDTLFSDMEQGHALAFEDILDQGKDQIVVGWRNPNAEEKTGIRLLYQGTDNQWTTYLVDDNNMACEDLKIADLNADGKPDIIAAGRATHNLIIYWNRSE